MPIEGQDDTKGDVYVLDRYCGNRDVKPKPTVNAERIDTDRFYAWGVYHDYPDMKRHYEERRDKERRKINKVKDWGRSALDALDAHKAMPPTKRLSLAEVLNAMYDAGYNGLTRPEMCRLLRRDGGKISGVMTDLHAAKIIFPLVGERR